MAEGLEAGADEADEAERRDRGWGAAAVRVGLFAVFALLYGPAASVFAFLSETLALLGLWLLVGDGSTRLGTRLPVTLIFLPFGAFLAMVLLFLSSSLGEGGALQGAATLRTVAGMWLPLLSGVAYACVMTLRGRSVGSGLAANPVVRIFLLVPAFMLGLGVGFAGGHRPEEGLWLVAGLVTVVGAGWDIGFFNEGTPVPEATSPDGPEP